MFNFKILTRGIFILLLCLGLGVTFSKLYQPEAKNIKIYKQALRDYYNENYSNSYFLYSKIGAVSPLKPIALYRQAMCAKKLGDKKSELKSYQQLISYHPKHKLANDARYYAGQLIIDENPSEAYRYFDKVSKSDMEEDFKIASEYYKARIESVKIRYSGKKTSDKKFKEVETAFRNYLEKYPNGRLAVNVAATWNKFNPNLSSADCTLIARAYLLAKNYQEAASFLARANEEDMWAVKSAMLYIQKDYKQADEMIAKWLIKENKTVYKEDYNRMIDGSISRFENNNQKYSKLSELLNIAKDPKKDYIWNLKCSFSSGDDKYSCYKELYSAFPNGEYSRNALFQTFMISLVKKEYHKCRGAAYEYLDKYANSKEAPMLMYWVAKIDNKSEYLNRILKQYPDSYYAYRAFWLTKHLNRATVNAPLKNKPVMYPYKMPSSKSVLYSLIALKDYEMIKKITQDKFIESWVEYEKGNYSTSMIIAKDAMANLEIKPDKSDLRWRLVYPQNYFKQAKKHALNSKNNEALMMAIMREESTFNTKAQSNVGAMGLMQLMPETAQEIASKNKIQLETIQLINPDININIGNLYYAQLRNSFENEVFAIASYNGGIGAVKNWQKKFSYSDIDEFIVQIPYEETKYYIEKVFGSYWNYTRIYQR